MNKGDRIRPFADCRRHALEAASADVADREHPGQARFQEIRGPGLRPICHGQIILRQIRPRFDEPFRVERDALARTTRRHRHNPLLSSKPAYSAQSPCRSHRETRPRRPGPTLPKLRQSFYDDRHARSPQ